MSRPAAMEGRGVPGSGDPGVRPPATPHPRLGAVPWVQQGDRTGQDWTGRATAGGVPEGGAEPPPRSPPAPAAPSRLGPLPLTPSRHTLSSLSAMAVGEPGARARRRPNLRRERPGPARASSPGASAAVRPSPGRGAPRGGARLSAGS
jgi:hypothetical protein